MTDHFGENSCFSREENLSNVSDFEDHQSPNTAEPCLKNYYPTVRNRLTERIDFWENIGASNWVLKILKEGYALLFVKQPPKVRFQNNKSALSAAEFVTKEIKDLLKSGCIKEIDESEAHVISPLSVVHKSTKPRLILDLSYLNQFLTVPKFKFEDIRSVKDLFQKGDYFFKFDIHKGYYHINIFEPHVKYLAFSWIIDGQVIYFAYTVLVFGLSPAPFVFTKVVKVLIKHWRSSE